LKFSQHVKIRATQAKQAFSRMARLTNTNKGLSPHAFRQLYLACITSIADYGSIIWYKGQKELIYPLKLLQNACIRKILGVFKTAPIILLEIESALAPVQIRLEDNIRKYAFRITKLAKTHSIQIATEELLRLRNIELERIKERIKELERISLIPSSISSLISTSSDELVGPTRSNSPEYASSNASTSVATPRLFYYDGFSDFSDFTPKILKSPKPPKPPKPRKSTAGKVETFTYTWCQLRTASNSFYYLAKLRRIS